VAFISIFFNKIQSKGLFSIMNLYLERICVINIDV
jgi:hypothetical protein